MTREPEQSAATIADWLRTEFGDSTLEYQHVDTDYQIQGDGISTWELDEGKDVFLYRIRIEIARYELEVTVMALEDHPIDRIMGLLNSQKVGEMLRHNPSRRIRVDRTLTPTVLK